MRRLGALMVIECVETGMQTRRGWERFICRTGWRSGSEVLNNDLCKIEFAFLSFFVSLFYYCNLPAMD